MMENEKMEKVYKAALPGFYIDARGAYGIVCGRLYFNCLTNPDDGLYNVRVDAMGENGLFSRNIDFLPCDTAKDAVMQLKHKLRYYSQLI
ncbi:MAG: hypothetical protein NC489_45030 [Ruminococcus flavefaciens]|nr:hypothetical protein [Ruminococcus flavefaciens]